MWQNLPAIKKKMWSVLCAILTHAKCGCLLVAVVVGAAVVAVVCVVERAMPVGLVPLP